MNIDETPDKEDRLPKQEGATTQEESEGGTFLWITIPKIDHNYSRIDLLKRLKNYDRFTAIVVLLVSKVFEEVLNTL